MKPGSVRLEPTLIMNRELWSLTLKIGCGDASYIIKSISKFVADMHNGAYVSYGQKLSFTHTPDMLEPFSLQLFRFLQGVVGSRAAAQLQNNYYYAPDVRIEREIMLTDGELCDLLNLFEAEPQQDYIEDVLIARGPLEAPKHEGRERRGSSLRMISPIRMTPLRAMSKWPRQGVQIAYYRHIRWQSAISVHRRICEGRRFVGRAYHVEPYHHGSDCWAAGRVPHECRA